VQETGTPAADTPVRFSQRCRYASAQVASAAPLAADQGLIKPSRIKALWVHIPDTGQWVLTQVTVCGQRMRRDGAGTLPGSERSVLWRAKYLNEAPAWVHDFVAAEQPISTRSEN